MENVTFETMVPRLIKPSLRIMDELTPCKLQVLHMALGIAGEAAEVQQEIRNLNGDNSKLIIELGDVEFYFEGMSLDMASGLPISQTGLIPEQYGNDITEKACVLIEVVKKWTMNDKFNANYFHVALLDVRYSLECIYRTYLIDREEALQANVKKLSKRYEGLMYTDEAASAKRDET